MGGGSLWLFFGGWRTRRVLDCRGMYNVLEKLGKRWTMYC